MSEFFMLAGGIGLFLYGMQALTQELTVLASDSARRAIRRFAGRPLSGMAAGAAVTALIQSSSATMVMTLGFVGAGILSFSQSLGIVLGANVGTTFTGWMVMLLGLKVNLGTLAFPVLFVAALARILGRGAVQRLAGVLAGLCLIFIGIDLMKGGMAVFDGLLSPERLPADTLAGRLQLLALGMTVTVITQSSSAGVAAAIVLLSEGHVSFAQAAALVIGMTVGTTFTGVLASLGGNIAMRRTALAHLIFNLTQGLVALSLLDLLVRGIAAGFSLADAALALVLFHTAFTLAGALIFLPFTKAFARLVSRLVPEKPLPIERELDSRFLSDPAAALDIALAAGRRQAAGLMGAVGAMLAPGSQPQEAAIDAQRFTGETEALAGFLARINLPEADPLREQRAGEMMALVDHLRRFAFRAAQPARMSAALHEPRLRREALFFGALLREMARLQGLAAAQRTGEQAGNEARTNALHAKLLRAEARLARREARLRRQVLASRAAPPRLFAVTDAMRWLRRSTAHAGRIVHHLRSAASLAQPVEAPAAAPDALLGSE
ncbi:MAG: Na/Pi cotransporter family protein [Pararhodobacter sp.]